jgi:tRNA pseudouridine13 synthase
MQRIDKAGDPTLELPYAHGGPVLSGVLRARPEDFEVDEILGYTASGEGEHDFVCIRKRERNTHDVARLLAKYAGVGQVAVGYAGLKDRNAVTTQTFTVQLPGRDSPDWSALADDSLEILAVDRHHRKIRRGSLRGNRFVIRVSDIAGDRELAEQRLQQVARFGVPNYFGSQRFGRDGNNLVRVKDLFAGRGRRPGREQRGLLLSAARSQLFNAVLAARVCREQWSLAVTGDVLCLAGSCRQFAFDREDATLTERIAGLDVHPTGPLPGRPSRALVTEDRAAEIEAEVLNEWSDWIDGLVRFGLDADRRALRLVVEDLQWQWSGETLELGFALTSGAYATAVLREIVQSPPTAVVQ